ncbi:cystinosin homolog [Actinia tenebrosa]|uniref:Cystinosin homolog n=1 Tax=Actinia tenebrosa TaxID=6105 RepID=A0A6P8I353_ACTTE|nr:cystinosin homolog [Actinia tenebrosa]
MALENGLSVIADVVGWGYFLAWTISFYPQIYENCRRKSVIGYSFDMVAYFLLSYLTYLVYNAVVYFDIQIQQEMIGKTHESNPVKLTDVVFALVAFVCTAIQGLQCFFFERGSQKVHISTWVVCCLALLALGALSLFAAFKLLSWVLVLQYCGYLKLAVSFGTYTPQVWLNYHRKSTEGFHIGGVLLDFSGGVLSLLQMNIYCIIEHSNKQFTGNIPKMALSVVTLIFNIILISQHYVIYMGNPLPELRPQLTEEKHQLIASGGRSNINIYHSINVDANDGTSNAGSISVSKC